MHDGSVFALHLRGRGACLSGGERQDRQANFMDAPEFPVAPCLKKAMLITPAK